MRHTLAYPGDTAGRRCACAYLGRLVRRARRIAGDDVNSRATLLALRLAQSRPRDRDALSIGAGASAIARNGLR
jgi:hypothetical protein